MFFSDKVTFGYPNPTARTPRLSCNFDRPLIGFGIWIFLRHLYACIIVVRIIARLTLVMVLVPVVETVVVTVIPNPNPFK